MYNLNRKLFILFIIIFLILMTIFNTVNCDTSNTSIVKKISSVCPSLQVLRKKVQYSRNSKEANGIIKEIHGNPNRFFGSGISIAQWDMEGGFLYSHPYFGVSFSKRDYDISDSEAIFFINTENKVAENIIGIYTMIALQTKVKGSQYFYGFLKLDKNGKYNFKDEIWEEEQPKQKHNFFHNNPNGTYTVEYYKNIKPDTLLEKIQDSTMLARIKFISDRQTIKMFFSTKGRTIESNKASSFQLYKYWEHFFYRKPIQPDTQSLDLLKKEIKYAESYEDAVQIVIDMYGEPHKITKGSQWDIEGGVLTCSRYTGVSYEKNNVTIYLIDTKNIVEKTVQGYYVMFGLSEQNVNETTYLIGGIRLKSNGKFTLESSQPNKTWDTEGSDNFFVKNREGTYIIEYSNGIKADDLLENMADGTRVAKLRFFSKSDIESFDVYIKGRTLVLKPADGKRRTYTLYKYWENYHKKDGTK